MRQIILNTIINDITRISKDNGYTHDAPEASAYYSKLEDISIAPHINLYCGSEQCVPVEPGLQCSLKVNILSHIQVNTDVKKEGLVTKETESWIADFRNFFMYPSCAGAEVSKICTLWSVTGVINYYISAVEPYFDRNDNRHTVYFELTVDFLLAS